MYSRRPNFSLNIQISSTILSRGVITGRIQSRIVLNHGEHWSHRSGMAGVLHRTIVRIQVSIVSDRTALSRILVVHFYDFQYTPEQRGENFILSFKIESLLPNFLSKLNTDVTAYSLLICLISSQPWTYPIRQLSFVWRLTTQVATPKGHRIYLSLLLPLSLPVVTLLSHLTKLPTASPMLSLGLKPTLTCEH